MSKLPGFDSRVWDPRGYRHFRLLLLGIVAAYLFALPRASAEDRPLQLVIVTSQQSSIKVMSGPLLRKVYLGSASGIGFQPIQPLINQSNRMLQEMFLQKVLFMSQNTYERHLRHTKFPTGTVLPVAYRSEVKLIDYLNAHPNSITCLTEQAAAKRPSLRVVMRL